MCIIELFEQELKLSKANQTVKSYTKQFRLFLKYFNGHDIRYISEDNLKKYIISLQAIYGYSSIVHAISAIKFYYSNVCARKRTVKIPNPPKPKTLPVFLSIDEVKRMIDSTSNLKHKAIISTVFFHGLRRAELLNLKIEHIDSSNMILHVKQSKGFKDRNIPLSEQCLDLLRQYFSKYRPNEYLFNGDNSLQYSATSLSNIIKQSAKRAKINKSVTPHTLRHSFASYLVSIDINLKSIQDWLGHSSSRTTETYCHVTTKSNPIKF